MRCLTTARYTMDAELLHWTGIQDGTTTDVSSGHWETYQDPITGEIRNKWIPAPADDPATPDVETTVKTFPCIARGIVDGGIRAMSNTEVFGSDYENIEVIKMWTPASVRITKNDRITNIRAKKGGDVIWVDEEYTGATDRPTVFNVMGVTPLFDGPFNRHVENYIILEKVDGANA